MNSELKVLLHSRFLSFARKALRELENVTLGDEHYLKYLAREFELFAGGDTPRLIVNLPPGHLKTSLGSVCLTAWLLGHEPSLKVIVASYGEHLSTSIARKIRAILQCGWYREVFKTRVPKDHSSVTDFGTTAGGGVFVTSFGARFTGRRADLIIVDDPHDIEDDVEQLKETIKTFTTVLLSRLNDLKKGRVLVIAHRVHEHDLSAYLQGRDRWKSVVLPLVATTDAVYETTAGVWRRRKGDLLRPRHFDASDIEELRKGSFNPDFGMLYQQDADSQALPTITADHFPCFGEWPAFSGPIVLSVDPGVSARNTSAYSVLQTWLLTPEHFFLLDQFREQVDFIGLRERISRFRRRYQPQAILVERAANGHALISDLARKFPRLVHPVDPDGRSKTTRFLMHAETILSRRLCVPASAVWRNAYVREFCDFPKGTFSDQVDATTQLLDHASDLLVRLPSAGQCERGIAVTGSGRSVQAAPSRDGERGFVGTTIPRGRGRGSSAGPIFKIKTDVIY
jgi:predicted phage terminase large subunit-like protein